MDCVAFLQWVLPRLGRRWAGYRKVRRQVCRRVQRRIGELGLDGFEAYREHLEAQADEWAVLDGLMNVTISRFNRDRGVFEYLARTVPQGARVWSAGCASGEEPYTLALLREDLEILATDADPNMLRRAEAARYPDSALRELPDREAFTDGVLHERYRRRVSFARHDIRDEPPAGPFDLVLCRNLAFTYFDEPTQRDVLRNIASVTELLVIGAHERLPGGETARHGVFRLH
jgi:chemotaxis protein methyltransferase CheR